MRAGEKLQLRVAMIGAAATLLAAVLGAGVQLLDDPPAKAESSLNCAATVERVVRIAGLNPRVATLYAQGVFGLPRLAGEGEERSCGDPRILLALLSERRSR